jgi:hypothetical protein
MGGSGAATSPDAESEPPTPERHRYSDGAALLFLRGSATGPSTKVEGLFRVLLCADCQAVVWGRRRDVSR